MYFFNQYNYICNNINNTDIASIEYKFNILKYYCLCEINKIDINRDIRNNNKKFNIKYSNEYFLSMILKILNTFTTWKNLENDKIYINKTKYHYKTIFNKFKLWNSHGVFLNALKNFNINYSYYYHTNTLIIDATLISNLYGSENVAINRSNMKHNASNLSLISDTNKIIYSCILSNVNNKVSKKGDIYHTLPHDVTLIQNHLDELSYINNNNSKYYTLLGDKGYKTSKKFLLHDKNVNIITPNKRNSIKQNNKLQKNKLYKNRRKIEHVNAILKKNYRINIRYDKSKDSYSNFCYLSSLLNNVTQYINILKDKFTKINIDKMLIG